MVNFALLWQWRMGIPVLGGRSLFMASRSTFKLPQSPHTVTIKGVRNALFSHIPLRRVFELRFKQGICLTKPTKRREEVKWAFYCVF